MSLESVALKSYGLYCQQTRKWIRKGDIQLTQPFTGLMSNDKFKSFLLHFQSKWN